MTENAASEAVNYEGPVFHTVTAEDERDVSVRGGCTKGNLNCYVLTYSALVSQCHAMMTFVMPPNGVPSECAQWGVFGV